MIMIYYKP